MNKKINLYTLTGFLGSGKTTILKSILTDFQNQKIGVIQNEFGKLNIDGEILRNDKIKMIEISKGSIFCSCLKLSFVEALVEMSKQDIDTLFVESSGLADPSNMEEILAAVKVLAGDVYDFKGVICLIDGLNFESQIEDIETVERQLKHCNIAMISKIDLINSEKIEEITRKIRMFNPVCLIETSALGKFNINFLKEDLMLYKWAETEETTNSVDNKPKTLFINCHKSIKMAKFQQFLDEIKKSCYRLKGFFLIDDKWFQVDVVGDKVDYLPCDAKEYSQIVIISKIGSDIIKPIFDIWFEIFGEKPELKN
ncbi:MAG: CobW family GTP-binding protein [Oscillospiraceae bacterium]